MKSRFSLLLAGTILLLGTVGAAESPFSQASLQRLEKADPAAFTVLRHHMAKHPQYFTPGTPEHQALATLIESTRRRAAEGEPGSLSIVNQMDGGAQTLLAMVIDVESRKQWEARNQEKASQMLAQMRQLEADPEFLRKEQEYLNLAAARYPDATDPASALAVEARRVFNWWQSCADPRCLQPDRGLLAYTEAAAWLAQARQAAIAAASRQAQIAREAEASRLQQEAAALQQAQIAARQAEAQRQWALANPPPPAPRYTPPAYDPPTYDDSATARALQEIRDAIEHANIMRIHNDFTNAPWQVGGR